jgi:hypothetical protein
LKAGGGIQPEGEGLIANIQIPAEGWYVAHPDLDGTDVHRSVKRVGKAADEFLDKIG